MVHPKASSMFNSDSSLYERKTKYALLAHKNNPNACPYWIGVTIGSQKCVDTAYRSHAICKDCKITGR